MAKYFCLVETNSGTFEVSIEAGSDYQAKVLLDAQYGSSKVVGWPSETKSWS